MLYWMIETVYHRCPEDEICMCLPRTKSLVFHEHRFQELWLWDWCELWSLLCVRLDWRIKKKKRKRNKPKLRVAMVVRDLGEIFILRARERIVMGPGVVRRGWGIILPDRLTLTRCVVNARVPCIRIHSWWLQVLCYSNEWRDYLSPKSFASGCSFL